MEIVILDAATLVNDNDIDFSIFDKFGNVTVYNYTLESQVKERIKPADVVLCNKSNMSKENMTGANNLKYIGLFATGYNNIDLDYTKEHNITVCNAGSYSTNAVAQHVFAFILNFYNKIATYNDFVQQGGWIDSDRFSPFVSMEEIEGKTLGIIGYGSIGKRVAKIGLAFGMNILVNKRKVTEKDKTEGVKFVAVDELLAKSDVVTIHCPLNNDSKKMCNIDFFGKMKNGAIFINTSRGGVVDEDALVDILEKGKIKFAALDVIDKEPMSADCKLINHKNLVITPHAAWAPLETRKRLIEIVSKNLEKWLAGTPINVIE